MTREEAIKALRETYCGNRAFCELFKVDLCLTTDCEIYHAIKALEAEPIVRCKDCRYNYANMIPGGKGCQRNVYIETADNWYCADGEREEVE